MKLINNIKSFFGVKELVVTPNKKNALQWFNQSITTNENFDVIKQMQTGWSEICLAKRQNLVANQDYYVANYDKVSSTYQEIKTENWLKNLLDNPSVSFDFDIKQIIGLATRYVDLTGNAYLWFRRSGNGVKLNLPVEIILLPTREVTLQLGTDKSNSYYEVTLNNIFLKIPYDEVCHIKTFRVPLSSDNSLYFYQGASNFAEPLRLDLYSDYLIREYANTELVRQGMPSLVYKSDNVIDGIVLEQLRLAMVSMYGKYAPKIISAELGNSLEPLQTTATFLSSNTTLYKDSLSTDIAQRVCSAYGVPYKLITNDIPFANFNEALKMFYTQTIDPLTADNIGQINQYLKTLDETVSIQFNPFEYINVVESKLIIDTLLMADAVTKDEVREWANYDIMTNEQTNDIEDANTNQADKNQADKIVKLEDDKTKSIIDEVRYRFNKQLEKL